MLLLVGLSACRRDSPAGPQRAKLTDRRRSALSLPLRHDVPGGSTLLPLVAVEINGVATRMLVDTGATFHAITKGFASRASIQTTTASGSLRDHVASQLLVERGSNISIVANGIPIARDAAIPVVASANAEQNLDVGGFLAPYLLAPPGLKLVLDLPDNVLIVAEGALGHQEPSSQGASLTPHGAQLCKGDGRGQSRRYLVPATIDDMQVLLELDTGSEESHIFANSDVGRALSKRAGKTEQRSSIAGAYEASRVSGVRVSAGDVRAVVDVLLIPGESPSDCKFAGMLGMDVLKNCAIVLDQEDAFARCRS